jgi:hypothetical protein
LSNTNPYPPSNASAARLNEGCDPYANAPASSGARSTYGSTYGGSACTNNRKHTLGLVALTALDKRIVGAVNLGGWFVLGLCACLTSFSPVLSLPTLFSPFTDALFISLSDFFHFISCFTIRLSPLYSTSSPRLRFCVSRAPRLLRDVWRGMWLTRWSC